MSGHRVPSPSDAFYAATKHALRALAEGLRQEVCFAFAASCTRLTCHFLDFCEPVCRACVFDSERRTPGVILIACLALRWAHVGDTMFASC